MAAASWPLALPARTATIDVSDIEPGMQGHGLTVFRGTEPERFDVEVIDVLHGFRPDQDLILIRTPHPRLEVTQSVAGMSGSPIYLDGRLAGAYAYGWGFGSEPIAGVTPIANMLHELERPMRALPAPVGHALGQAAPARHAELPAAAPDLDALAPLRRHAARHAEPEASAGATPLATPVMLAGMTPEVTQMLDRHLRPLGLQVLQGGGSSPRGPQAGAEHFVDGGAMAVQLIRGDIQATAVGTVTYVDGDRLIGFGHPMLDGGQVSLPTATARVLHLLASRRTSFKIAEALTPRGALVQDRQAAVVVDQQANPETIPVRVRLHGAEGASRTEWNAEIARHDLLTPPLLLSMASSALGSVLSDETPMAIEIRSTVWLRGRAPYRSVNAVYSERGAASPGYFTQLDAFRVLNTALHNRFEQAHPERVELDFHVSFGRRATEIVAASLPAGELEPGSQVPLTLTLRALDREEQRRVVMLDIPHHLAGESLQIDIQPGDEAEPVVGIARNLDEQLENVLKGFPDRSLVITIQRSDRRGARMAGHVLNDLPASAIYALAAQNDSRRATPFTSERHVVVPMDTVLFGSASLTAEVRKDSRWVDDED